jgi:hypothetical protein
MVDSGDAKIIGRVATLYYRGIICPAEMWNQITDRVTTRDAVTILDEMPLDIQEILRSAYRDRPLSLCLDTHDDDARREIERWCRIDRNA